MEENLDIVRAVVIFLTMTNSCLSVLDFLWTVFVSNRMHDLLILYQQVTFFVIVFAFSLN